jgi:hypothetical protein
VTEAEWLECDDLWRLLGARHVQASPRKLRLFAVACCRRLAHLMDEMSLSALDFAERYADGLADPAELCRARDAARQAEKALKRGLLNAERRDAAQAARVAANEQALVAADAVRHCRYALNRLAGEPYWSGDQASGELVLLLREVYGNPFRPSGLLPAWRTPDVLSLARAAYSDRIAPSGELSSVALAVLSDALEDAGCDDAGLLGHLRGAGPHVRGCWALDLVLGKQ